MMAGYKGNSARRSTGGVRDRIGEPVYRVRPAVASSENLDFMAADPNVDLFEAGFENFLVVLKELIRWFRSRNIDDQPQE
jgi:hypothetical protein